MRFLADEGADAAIVSAIRSKGHDVRWMEAPQVSDSGSGGLNHV